MNTVKCNGKLGKYYNLKLDYSIDKDDSISSTPTNKLILKASIEILDRDYIIKNSPDNIAVLSIKINDYVISNQIVDLSFIKTNILSIGYINYFYNENNETIDVDVELSTDMKSKYLEDTILSTKIIIPAIEPEPQLCIFNNIERITDKIVQFTVSTNIKPEFLEFKVNSNPWKKLDKPFTFTIEKTENTKIIQVRGRLNNQYYYSKVTRIVDNRIVI